MFCQDTPPPHTFPLSMGLGGEYCQDIHTDTHFSVGLVVCWVRRLVHRQSLQHGSGWWAGSGYPHRYPLQQGVPTLCNIYTAMERPLVHGPCGMLDQDTHMGTSPAWAWWYTVSEDPNRHPFQGGHMCCAVSGDSHTDTLSSKLCPHHVILTQLWRDLSQTVQAPGG